MSTLATLLGNLVDKPDDPKYKRIRLENGKLKSALFRFQGGVDAVRYARRGHAASHGRGHRVKHFCYHACDTACASLFFQGPRVS